MAFIHFQFNQFRKFIFFYIQILKKKKKVWHVKMIISNLLGNNDKQLICNCSLGWLFFSVDCVESEWTTSPGFLLFLLPLLPPSSSSSAHLVLHVSVGHVWARAGVLLSSGLGRERDGRMKEGKRWESDGERSEIRQMRGQEEWDVKG